MRGLYKRSKKVHGVGINDSDYNVAIRRGGKVVWRCPYYNTWAGMLQRCCSDKLKSRHPTYNNCSVCEEWLTFSNFKAWMEQQDWEGKQLDKDLLKVGNKVYCPEWCIFVERVVNSFVTDRVNARGDCMLGVFQRKTTNKFVAQCCNPFTGKQEHLGVFTDELEAHLVWKTRKHQLACELADSDLVTDERLAEALRTRYK